MGHDLQLLLVQIGIILILARVVGTLMRLVHQPQVVGEMLAGIMLGPSVLGALAPQTYAWLFPQHNLMTLNALSQVGVIFFMFLIGLELDPKLIRGQGKAVLATGLSSVLAPFALGLGLGWFLLNWGERFGPIPGVISSRLGFVLFMGTAMAITAFPVLARILAERNLQKTRLGVVALACAAINDVLGWCILAVVLAVVPVKGVAGGGSAVGSAALTFFYALLFAATMILLGRPLLRQLQASFDSRGHLSQNVMALVLLVLLVCCYVTDKIGIHAVFGAFMLGAVMPTETRFVRHLSEKFEDVTVVFFLPLFFAYTGLRTNLGQLQGGGLWTACGLIVAVAIAGKVAPSLIAARWAGLSWRQAGLLGVLLNTRGLMELIILNIGLDVGAISPPIFAMMVVMAILTTCLTKPLMRVLYSPARQKVELDEAVPEPAAAQPGDVRILVPVSQPESAATLTRMAAMLLAGEPGRLFGLQLHRASEGPTFSQREQSEEALDAALLAAREQRVPINAVSQISHDVGGDICANARRVKANWIVMGWHKPMLFQSVLGGTVGKVLEDAPSHVAILVDKGLGQVKSLVVPYLGEPQDVGALLAAERLGKLPDVRVTILHVTKPKGDTGESTLGVRKLVERHLPAVGSANQIRMQVIESTSPIDVVVAESHRYDLMVLGISERWNLNAGLLGGSQESVAQLAACSLLIVHAVPNAPTVPAQAATPSPTGHA